MKLFHSVAIVALLTLPACGNKPANTLPPGGDLILKSKQAAVVIGTVQHAAIELNKIHVHDDNSVCADATDATCHPLVSDKNTGVVVDASTDALTAMKSIPAGWKTTALAALDRIIARLDAAGNTQLATYLNAAKAALNALGA